MSRERELLERAYYVLGELSYAMLKDSGEYNLAGDIYEFLSTPELEQDEEPVVWISHNGFRFNADIEPIEHGIEVPLYLHPAPRKPFVRLTDEEITEIIGPYSMGTVGGYTRKLFDTIQDVLEEKNK